MKTFLILIILFYQYQHICCFRNPFDFVVEKINGFFNNVAETFRNIKNTFINMISMNHSRHRGMTRDEQKDKEYFVHSTVENASTEIQDHVTSTPESVTLVSEPQVGVLHGKKVETHIVTTKDGYILTLHRILPENYTDLANKTVLLHHGLLGSSADWLLLGVNRSLPYILSETGYDVWMTNARGNYYSHKHVSIKSDTNEFWNFTWQDMGELDLPAVVDYIRNTANSNESISYVGHSMGATALLVLLSTFPDYNKYFKMGILLAPLAYMSDVKGPLKALSGITRKKHLSEMLGVNGEFFPSRRVPEWMAAKYCKGSKLYCRNPLFFISGGALQLTTRKTSFISKLLYHVPSGASTFTIIHYAQLIKNGKFHKFDNVSCEFSLKNVTLPIALFSSSDDMLATIPGVMNLYHNIPNPIDHEIIRNKNFSHTDFAWGSDADVLIYPKVIELLENGLKNNAINRNQI